MRPQRLDQAVLLDVAGPELEDQRPHLGQRVALELAQRDELLGHLRRVLVEQELDRARQERHREQRLGHRVVELAGEVRALLGRGELRGLAPEAALQPLALARRRGPRRARRGTVPSATMPMPVISIASSRPSRVRTLSRERCASVGRRWSHRNRASAPRRPSSGGEVGERAPEQLLGLPAEDLLRLVGHERELAVGVGHPDEVRRRLDEVAVALLGLAQLALQALPLADVARGPVDAREHAVDAHRGRRHLELAEGAVLVLQLHAGRERRRPSASSANRRPAGIPSGVRTMSRKWRPTTSCGTQPSTRSTDSEK